MDYTQLVLILIGLIMTAMGAIMTRLWDRLDKKQDKDDSERYFDRLENQFLEHRTETRESFARVFDKLETLKTKD